MRNSPNRPIRVWLLGIVTLGLLLRLLFVAKGAALYYGVGQQHLNGDSFSYVRSFLNLWQTGHYTFDPHLAEASFGRLPGYPFFYGLHYLAFGPQRVLLAVSVSQVLLDVVVIVLLHNMLRRVAGQVWPARVVALLYATYPFAIVWVTVVGTETLNTFLTVAWLSVLTRPAGGRWQYLAVGVLVAMALYVREYMGILLPISILFVLLKYGSGSLPGRWPWRRAALVLAGFAGLYVWWPVRNYLFQNQLVLLKPATAGYANMRDDMQAYLGWLHAWTNDNTTWLELMLRPALYSYPPTIFAGPAEERRAYALTALAARCGSSFHLRRIDSDDFARSQPPYFTSCNPQVAAGFDSLRRSYLERHPVRYYTAVPLANLAKAFFKSATVHPANSALRRLGQRLLFGYRSALLLLGLAALLIERRCALFWLVGAYSGFIYLFISFVFRSLEMRYLLQADVLLLLPAAWLLGRVLEGQKQLSVKKI